MFYTEQIYKKYTVGETKYDKPNCVCMRKSADWMTIWDDRILEAIREEGSGSPTPLSEHSYIHVQKSHISQRLKKLAEYGLLEHLGNGVYVITSDGEQYLDEKLDATELMARDEDNKL